MTIADEVNKAIGPMGEGTSDFGASVITWNRVAVASAELAKGPQHDANDHVVNQYPMGHELHDATEGWASMARGFEINNPYPKGHEQHAVMAPAIAHLRAQPWPRVMGYVKPDESDPMGSPGHPLKPVSDSPVAVNAYHMVHAIKRIGHIKTGLDSMDRVHEESLQRSRLLGKSALFQGMMEIRQLINKDAEIDPGIAPQVSEVTNEPSHPAVSHVGHLKYHLGDLNRHLANLYHSQAMHFDPISVGDESKAAAGDGEIWAMVAKALNI